VADEAFAWPYWDSSIGPFIRDEDGKRLIGQGDVRVRVFGANEVYWEPGIRFEDSDWHCVEQARSVAQVKAMEDYVGDELTEDANIKQLAHQSSKAQKAVLVTEYLEKPSAKRPNGLWCVVANGRKVSEDRAYPGSESCLHKLAYIIDPDSDRDMGLIRHMLDSQRTYNEIVNLLSLWRKLSLMPQMYVTPGLLKKQRITTEPGAVYQVPQPNENIRWRETPPVPRELFEMLNQAQGDMARIAAQNDIPSQVEAGKAIAALIERDQSRRASFVAQLADFHSSVMRHSLELVQRHYTEPRLLKLRGRLGWERIKDFQGADLRNQIDVRVLPGSIEPRSKKAVTEQVLAFADRGWVAPEQAMAAVQGGTAEKVVESYELDVARAHRVIQRIKEGPQALFDQPPRMEADPQTGAPTPVPAWMPRRFDNIAVHKTIFEDFQKSEDFEQLEAGMQSAVQEYYQGLLRLQAEKDAEAAQAQTMQAEQLGMANAAKTQRAKPTPDQPKPEGNGLLTKNQPPQQSVPSG
jgi:hypothetical protein